MTLVVDASVVVAALTYTGPHGRWAQDATALDHLVGPEMVLAEASHILRKLEGSNRISTPQATAWHRRLPVLSIELYPFGPCAERVWQLRHNVASYDAWYVALAERLGCPLVTLDLRLSRASGPTCDFLTPSDA